MSQYGKRHSHPAVPECSDPFEALTWISGNFRELVEGAHDDLGASTTIAASVVRSGGTLQVLLSSRRAVGNGASVEVVVSHFNTPHCALQISKHKTRDHTSRTRQIQTNPYLRRISTPACIFVFFNYLSTISSQRFTY